MDIILFSMGFCVTDIAKKEISDKWVILCLLFGALKIIFNKELFVYMTSGLISALIISYIVYFFSRGGFGLGDVKMLGCIGMYIGTLQFINVFTVALMITVIFGGILFILKKADRNTEVPFAPFVTLSLIAVLLLKGV